MCFFLGKFLAVTKSGGANDTKDYHFWNSGLKSPHYEDNNPDVAMFQHVAKL